jgi:hypothetical protein
MARPKKVSPRKHEIKFRCTLLEKKAIEKQAENAGLKTAEYCRTAAFKQKISYKLTAEEIEVYKMLAEYRNNFRHIGNLFREKSDIKEEVKTLVKLLDEHLKKLV